MRIYSHYRVPGRESICWLGLLLATAVPLMPDLVYQYSCTVRTRILDLQYSTVVLGSYTAVQHRSYCITVLAVRILLYELYSTVLYCTTSIGHANGEFSVCILI